MSGLRRPIKAEQRLVSQKFFKIELDGTGASLTVGATDGTLVRSNVGVYEITYNEQFHRLMNAQVSVLESDAQAYVVDAETDETKVRVTVTKANGSTAEDSSCYVMVTGADAEES